jgi:hypothetical protein
VLTKRPERLERMFNRTGLEGRCPAPGAWFKSLVEAETCKLGHEIRFSGSARWPLPNGWVGTTIESDQYLPR